MTELEGVIKYQLDFVAHPLPPTADVASLERWRATLLGLRLVGQDAGRYEGLGFGNLSMRWPHGSSSFLITGSQTGHLSPLDASHYAWVKAWNIQANRIEAEGETPPSSESLSHALLYELDPAIGAVVHVHSPEIWNQADRLGLAGTPKDCPYGTLALAESIRALYTQGALRDNSLFVMRGHEDGVIAFGRTPEDAVAHLLSTHARALLLN